MTKSIRNLILHNYYFQVDENSVGVCCTLNCVNVCIIIYFCVYFAASIPKRHEPPHTQTHTHLRTSNKAVHSEFCEGKQSGTDSGRASGRNHSPGSLGLCVCVCVCVFCMYESLHKISILIRFLFLSTKILFYNLKCIYIFFVILCLRGRNLHKLN